MLEKVNLNKSLTCEHSLLFSNDGNILSFLFDKTSILRILCIL